MDFNAIGKAAALNESGAKPIVKGRVLQYDADFACYECAFLDDSVQTNYKQLLKHIDVKRQMAGAQFVNVHLTLGMKGGREQIATVKAYQEQRDPNVPIKVRVRELRNMLVNTRTETIKPIINTLQEADDSITQHQTAMIKAGKEQLSVCMSGDKDLWMVQGVHCDPKDGYMWTVNGYGKTDYKDVGNVKPKLVGEGTSWFWHQMLMGDKADNIPGLPKLSGRLANIYVPTKKLNPKRTALACGEAKAVAVLKDVKYDQVAAARVYECYLDHYGQQASEMLWEQGFLLWMRRTNSLFDVTKYFAECGLDFVKESEAQKDRLREFAKLAKIQKEQIQ